MAGKVWIRVFPDKPITKKPLETRMGKGKGAPDQLGGGREGRSGHVRDGGGARRSIAREAFRLAAHKLPIKTKVAVARIGARAEVV